MAIQEQNEVCLLRVRSRGSSRYSRDHPRGGKVSATVAALVRSRRKWKGGREEGVNMSKSEPAHKRHLDDVQRASYSGSSYRKREGRL